jgi:hypothetical protein
LLNARKHGGKAARLRAVNVRLDPASSARWFDGWKGKLSPVMRRAPADLATEPVVARAHTWLLTRGWRIHGLLDPAEIPGTGQG